MDIEPMTVSTDLFDHREIKPHCINPCCFREGSGRSEGPNQDPAEWVVSVAYDPSTPGDHGARSMTDDRVVRLLEEIRDLQRQQGERYAEALRNQQESIRLQ